MTSRLRREGKRVVLMLGETSGVAGAVECDHRSAGFVLYCFRRLGVGRSHESATSTLRGYK